MDFPSMNGDTSQKVCLSEPPEQVDRNLIYCLFANGKHIIPGNQQILPFFINNDRFCCVN